MARRVSALQRAQTRRAYLFLLPNIAGFFVFILGPAVASLLLAFTNWDLLTPIQFVGLANFKEMAGDRDFRQALWNTVYYTAASVPLSIAFSLMLALVLNKVVRGISFLRAAYFIPVISSTVAVAIVWMWIYEPEGGILNRLLSLIGIEGPQWLTDPSWAMPAVILMSVWKNLGYNMVIFLAGLQGIPSHLYEAARIDGANQWSQFWYITVPLLSNTTFFVVIMSVISSFQVFDQAYVMTKGGPAGATMTVVYYLYQNGFQFFRMGYAAAIAWFLFVIVFAISVIEWRAGGRYVHY
ncbi:MAG: sugar ABC transporter permease [Bacillota bacterium]|nr:sugar ABC transporter permease [Bacillota bacterium]